MPKIGWLVIFEVFCLSDGHAGEVVYLTARDRCEQPLKFGLAFQESWRKFMMGMITHSVQENLPPNGDYNLALDQTLVNIFIGHVRAAEKFRPPELTDKEFEEVFQARELVRFFKRQIQLRVEKLNADISSEMSAQRKYELALRKAALVDTLKTYGLWAVH